MAVSKKTLIRFDRAMKTILGGKANFDVLESFLGALFEDDRVKILNILESEGNQKSAIKNIYLCYMMEGVN